MELIFQLYRHGDRTPVSPYKNDPYRNESCWPVPYGQLTNVRKAITINLDDYVQRESILCPFNITNVFPGCLYLIINVSRRVRHNIAKSDLGNNLQLFSILYEEDKNRFRQQVEFLNESRHEQSLEENLTKNIKISNRF